MTGTSSCDARGRPRRHATLIPGACALLLAASAPVAGQPVISPRVAGLYVGQERVVEGRVVATQREGNTVVLRFGPGPKDFVALLSPGLLSGFPARPEDAYRDRTVRVAGTIRSFRGVPQIALRDAAGIRIVGPATAADGGGPLAAPAAPAAPGPAGDLDAEIRALRAALETLTRRVEALERGHGR